MNGNPSTIRPRQMRLSLEDRPIQLLLLSHELRGYASDDINMYLRIGRNVAINKQKALYIQVGIIKMIKTKEKHTEQHIPITFRGVGKYAEVHSDCGAVYTL